jgi:D-xylose transport system permease protein
VSTADVVGQDHSAPTLPEEELREGLAGLWDRAWLNLRTGNLGPVPIIVGQIAVVVIFAFTATNFFTAVNFVNLITESAGTAMLAFGVVFVLLLGEIDLSIGYLAGIGALVVAELQLPGSAWHIPSVAHIPGGILAMAIAVLACAAIGIFQGGIVAIVGVPSFVVTLAGFLVWQGVILNTLEQRGTIIIQDRWINYTDSYIFSHWLGWLVAAFFTALYPVSIAYKLIVARGTEIARQNWWLVGGKIIGIGLAAFGTVAICNHGTIIDTPEGLPLAGVIVVLFFVLLTFLAKWTTFGRHVYAVGGNAEAARRAGINVPRIRILVFMISGATAGMGGVMFASQVNSVALTFPPGNLLLNAIASAVIGGVSLFGGRGEVRGALLGALLIGTLQNGLNTLSISNGWIYIVTGLVLLFAVTLDTFARRLQARSGR